MSRSQTVVSRTALITLGMGVQGIARLGYTVVIGRFAGSGDLGDTSALLSVAVYLSLVLPAGLGVAASRYLPIGELSGGALRILNRWFWVSSTVLAAIAFPISFGITGDPWLSLSAVVLVWSYNAYVYTRGVLMGEDRIVRATVADTIAAFVAITALVLVLTAQVSWALLLPLALGYAVFAFLGRPVSEPGEASPQQRATIARFVRDSTIGAMATGGLLPATMVFVRAFDTPHIADLFAAALSLATPASMVSQALNQVLIPHFARLNRDPAALQASSRKLTAATIALFAVVFGLIIWLAPVILSVIYGDKYADGALPLRALLAIVFFISATCAPSAYLVAAGRQRAFATIWLVAFIVGTLTMVIASPALAMWGALLGFAVGGGGGSLAVIIAGLVLPAGRMVEDHEAAR